MRDFASLAPPLLFLELPLASRAASIQILSSARSITTSAYLTDDGIEMSDADADTTFAQFAIEIPSRRQHSSSFVCDEKGGGSNNFAFERLRLVSRRSG